VRNEFDLSASENLIAASAPIVSSILSENEMKQQVLLPPRSSEVRDVFDFSASDILMAPSSPMLFPVF
jgi:hypothetical protein